jgi:dipeptidyl aminopeptidase/acylaminoacyl peptidase
MNWTGGAVQRFCTNLLTTTLLFSTRSRAIRMIPYKGIDTYYICVLPFRVFGTFPTQISSFSALPPILIPGPTSSPSDNSIVCTFLKTLTKSPKNLFFRINHLRTLSFSVSSNPFACHSYENCRVYQNNSHSGTHHRSLQLPAPLSSCARVSVAMRKQHALFAFAASVSLGLLVPTPSRAQNGRGATAEDYFQFQFIADPRLSPDGKSVAYVFTTIDQKKNRRESSVWLVPADGSAPPRRLSAEGFNSNSPRWSPDGKTLAILSTRNTDSAPGTDAPKAQIYLLPMTTGGEALVLTKQKNGVQSYQWSPDGTRFVVVSSTGPLDGVAPADRKSDVRHYTHIQYKFNDTGWYDDKRRHLWVVPVAGGEARQITTGQEWEDTDPQWSPDSTRIAFVSDRSGKAFDDNQKTDVWVIPASGGELKKISDHKFDDASPRWSPDGKQILFAGQPSARHQFPKLYVADSAGGSASQLALKDLDLIPTELRWSSAGQVFFGAGVKGQTQILRGDLTDHNFSAIISGERGVHAFDINADAGKMVYLANDFRHLDDLYVANLDGTGERKLTQLNHSLWTAELHSLQNVERVEYKSSDGWPIEGFFVKPFDWRVDKKYPMILVIHGGPEGMFGVDWYHEFQVYSGKGWAVFFCNPRGSTGYGEKFERGENNNWGVMDYKDVMAGVDAVLKEYPWVDAAKLGVTGGSYGGYLTNWIVGHTNRFKAAVTLRSVSNFISDEGTRDGAYGHEEYFKGLLFDDFDQYWEASPLKYARNVKTPTLVLHSDNDFRVPIEQGEQWFRALQHYGVPSEFVLFPRENHNLTRTGEPKHLVESLNWQVYWFDRYLNGNADAKPPDTQPPAKPGADK